MSAGVILAGRWGLVALAASHAAAVEAPQPTAVRVVAVRPERVAAGLSYTAAVRELEKAELSFRVSGNVEYLLPVRGPDGRARPVQEGDRITKGTVLARLDPGDFLRDKALAAERLATSEARLAQAESDANLARTDHGRSENLLRRGSVTQAEFDSTRARLQNTAAAVTAGRREVAAARVSLDQAEANLAYCALSVPFAEATVAQRHVDAFQRVTANQPAFRLLDLSSVRVAFLVPDTRVATLRAGMPLQVTTDALPGERFEGVVDKIGSTADAQTRTFPVEVRVDRPAGLRPGMVAEVHLAEERQAHLLPLTAVLPGEPAAVYRVEGDGAEAVVRRVPVTLGDVLDHRVAVTLGTSGRGLRPGDRVVATGVHRLRDGDAVRVVD